MDERLLSALARVFVPGGIAGERTLADVVRPDTPLTSLGPIDEAWPLLVCALDEAGLSITGTQLATVVTVGDLDRLVRA
jgi:hypothetical protein